MLADECMATHAANPPTDVVVGWAHERKDDALKGRWVCGSHGGEVGLGGVVGARDVGAGRLAAVFERRNCRRRTAAGDGGFSTFFSLISAVDKRIEVGFDNEKN